MLCPLCPKNGKVDIIDETAAGYLVKAKDSPIKDCYLIVPEKHITELHDLPRQWQLSVRELLRSVPWFKPYSSFNLSINIGISAGQRLDHLHFWVIPREEDQTSLSYAKGTATLIKELNAAAVVT